MSLSSNVYPQRPGEVCFSEVRPRTVTQHVPTRRSLHTVLKKYSEATPIAIIILTQNMTLVFSSYNVNSAFIVHLTLKGNFLLMNRRVVKKKKKSHDIRREVTIFNGIMHA